ncbi:MAG: glycoside hydrolase family 113 [Polyangiaceae bacterium]
MTGAAPIALAVAARLALASPGADAWTRAELGGVRGITIGPIENGYHPGVGYGSPAFDRALVEARAMGATWVSLTPFGRVADLSGTGVDLTFEAPFEQNRRDVARAVEMAHARGLHVMIVPPLWVESGEWRGQIDPKTDEGWERWTASYLHFIHKWAEVAQATRVEMFSVGVELRSWVTTGRAASFARVLDDVRRTYHGVVSYSANWDDVEETVILGQLDVIGINAFYPLSLEPGGPESKLAAGAREAGAHVHALAERWQKPVVFTETGYTTRPDPAVRPWEWPDAMSAVKVDEPAQAQAYRVLLAPLLDERDFAGFFVWRVYADPDDTSQEPPWGFSPRGKLAELVVRDAFAARWACDPWWRSAWNERARTPGLYP